MFTLFRPHNFPCTPSLRLTTVNPVGDRGKNGARFIGGFCRQDQRHIPQSASGLPAMGQLAGAPARVPSRNGYPLPHAVRQPIVLLQPRFVRLSCFPFWQKDTGDFGDIARIVDTPVVRPFQSQAQMLQRTIHSGRLDALLLGKLPL